MKPVDAAEPLYSQAFQAPTIDHCKPPHSGAIELLEGLLAQARSGELQSLAVATVAMRNGEVHTGSTWTLSPHAPSTVLLVGALEIVRARVLQSVISE